MKRITIFALALLLTLAALPASAQESTTHTVNYDGFSFTFDTAVAENVDITQFPGESSENGGSWFTEAKHTQFRFYSDMPPSESILDAAGGIRLYSTADFAGYDETQKRVEQLQKLNAEQPDLAQFMTVNGQDASINNLPFIPTFNAGQVLRARAEYLETPSFKGVRYLTIYRQDVSPFLANEVLYTFQGVTADGGKDVSAIFTLHTSLFPEEIEGDFNYETFSSQFNQYLTESVQKLNDAKPEDFTPSLDALDQIVTSMTLTNAK